MDNIDTGTFSPVSRRKRLFLENKKKTSTILLYQKGFINDSIAIRFFLRNKLFKTLISSKKSWNEEKDRDIWDLLSEFGGQSIDKARLQREECLTQIVRTYFHKLGYEIEEQPHLNGTTPDILISKKNGKYSCYIELKAYYKTTIVGEPEVAQLLKYYVNAQQNTELKKKIENNEAFPPKFILITTGNLIPLENNAIFNSEDTNQDIKSKYRKYVNKMGRPRDLEERDAQIIYIFSYKKFKKNYIECKPKVIQLNKPQHLDKLIETKNSTEVILIPAGVFAKMLYLANMKKEKILFSRVQKTKLERLLVDKDYLDYNNFSFN